MRLIRKSLVASLFLSSAVLPAAASQLCGSACDLSISFPTGGEIKAVQPLTLQFGNNGLLDTGSSVTAYVNGQELSLEDGEILTFESGGTLELGDSGNLDFTSVEIVTDGVFFVQATGGNEEVGILENQTFSMLAQTDEGRPRLQVADSDIHLEGCVILDSMEVESSDVFLGECVSIAELIGDSSSSLIVGDNEQVLVSGDDDSGSILTFGSGGVGVVSGSDTVMVWALPDDTLTLTPNSGSVLGGSNGVSISDNTDVIVLGVSDLVPDVSTTTVKLSEDEAIKLNELIELEDQEGLIEFVNDVQNSAGDEPDASVTNQSNDSSGPFAWIGCFILVVLMRVRSQRPK